MLLMTHEIRMTRDDLIQEVASNTKLHAILLEYLARYEFRSHLNVPVIIRI